MRQRGQGSSKELGFRGDEKGGNGMYTVVKYLQFIKRWARRKAGRGDLVVFVYIKNVLFVTSLTRLHRRVKIHRTWYQ